jgi:[citrate (pro-3S)-lyase] ligase
VEEDKSLFSFKDRFEMVRRGVADLENVVVITGGRYAVSSLTFPSYFTKEENLAKAHTAIDAEIFCRHIAPALGVKRRFLGTEPLSAVTAVYNETLKERLPRAGIEVTELDRLEKDGAPVSASRVRGLLGESLHRPSEEVLAELANLLPETSLEYMKAEVFHD